MNLPDLRQSFFEALLNQDFTRCDSIVAQLDAASITEPSYKPWALYFSATLMDERDHNWAAAEAAYNSLLSHEPLSDSLKCETLISFSIAYLKQGLWDLALEKSQAVLVLAITLDDIDVQRKALNGQANIYYEGFTKSDFGISVLTDAENCCMQALDLLSDGEKYTSKAAPQWNTLGNIYRSMGETRDAIDCFETLLEIGKKLKNNYFIAYAYHNLGACYELLGKRAEARVAYEDALNLFQTDYERLNVFSSLGYLYKSENKYAQALENYDQAIDLIDSVSAGLTSEDARTNFTTTITDVYANAVLTCDIARKDPLIDATVQMDYCVRAFNYTELARSRSFLDLLDNGSFEFEQADRAQPLDLAQVQAGLPKDALLLVYFTTGVIASSDRASKKGGYKRHHFPEDQILIFAVTHDHLHLHPATISPNLFYPKDRDDMVQTHFLDDRIRQTLYADLIKPFESLLQNRRVLYLVPHGPLHFLPFQAMLTGDGQTLLNADGPQLAYAPSASVLLRDLPISMDSEADEFGTLSQGGTRVNDRPPLRSCLAIGYNGDGADRLLLAENEATAIARLTEGDALVGAQPKKQLFFDSAAQYKHLFFSCHGVFDAADPLKSYLYIGEGERLYATEVLTDLKIARCRLLFLSACQSGLNRVHRGDELFGLMRAFLYAGASSLILTQWRIDERSTRIAIEKFCDHVIDGLEYAEALRQAQLYLQQLTKEDVLDILAGYDSDLDVSQQKSRQKGDQQGDISARYLDDLLERSQPGECVFADPFHWAPFILICDDRLSYRRSK